MNINGTFFLLGWFLVVQLVIINARYLMLYSLARFSNQILYYLQELLPLTDLEVFSSETDLQGF